MKKELNLSRWEAQQRILLFLKLRKGKVINDKTVKDLGVLIGKINQNFKHYETREMRTSTIEDYEAKEKALLVLKTGFIKFENGGYFRVSDIENFSYYTDGKYRAKIKGELKEISENDNIVLEYVLYNH